MTQQEFQSDGWYVAAGGHKHGPFSAAELAAKVAAGQIAPSDLVWHAGLAGWVPARDAPGVFAPPPLPLPEAHGAALAAADDAAAQRAATASAAPLGGPRQRNYFQRHWRGELSLPVSYWLNGFIVGFPAALLIWLTGEAFAQITQDDVQPGLMLGVVIVLWACAGALTTWQQVGIWRSARSYKGPRVWPVLARVAAILGIVRALTELGLHGVPQISELIQVTAGDPQVGPRSVRVLNDGTELELEGGIAFGTTEDVAKALDAAPAIKVIHLNSHGGRIAEARRLRNLIRERRLVTYTSTECLSACTIAFMGGVQRFIDSEASLGFHMSYMPGLTKADLARQNEEEKRALIADGVARPFAERAYSTPHWAIWHPTVEELIAGRVVTGVTRGGDLAGAGAFRPLSMAELEAALLNEPVYAALREVLPEQFAAMSAEVAKWAVEGRSLGEAIAGVRARMVGLSLRYLPVASDEAILKMTEIDAAKLRHLAATDVDACYFSLVPGRAPRGFLPADYLPIDFMEPEMQALRLIIETGARHSRPVPAREEIERTRSAALEKLIREFGADVDVLNRLDAPNVDRRKACLVSAAWREEVLRLPPAESVPLLRLVYSGP